MNFSGFKLVQIADRLLLFMQEQSLPVGTSSPAQMTLHSSSFPTIVYPNQNSLQEDLQAEYKQYQMSLRRSSFLSRVGQKITSFCNFSSDICQQIWCEIMPESIRGHLKSPSFHYSQVSNPKDKVFFQEYFKKKVRFFLIVFDSRCQEEEMQEAFQKATFLTIDGRGIRSDELSKQTKSNQWIIKRWKKFKKYTILFFKIDMFGYLFNFGHLTKETIDSAQDDPNFLENFKKQLDEAFSSFEQIEKDFVSSYLEKQDRLQFE